MSQLLNPEPAKSEQTKARELAATSSPPFLPLSFELVAAPKRVHREG